MQSGRPISVQDENTMMFVKKMVEEDPHITIQEISERTDLALGTVKRIFEDDLAFRKIAARLVLHLLTETKKKSRGSTVPKSYDWMLNNMRKKEPRPS